MKKFFIGMTGIALCLCLTACGKSSNPSSISGLSNQLDSTANALTSISTISPSQIDLSNTDKTTLCEDSRMTMQALLNEQYYKTEILDRTATLKNNLGEITLSKAQKSALGDLTNTLNKYTNSIVNTKYEMTSSAKSISSLKKDTSKNEEKLRAKYNRLACNSNMRSAYYENILNTLDEIEDCLNLNCPSCNKPNNQIQQEQNPADDLKDVADDNKIVENKNSKALLKKNIDTYQNKNDINESENIENEILPERNTRRHFYHNPNRTNTVYNRFERFNPTRNTDTYGPNRRNIDSFGGYGYNGGYGFNNYGGYGFNGIAQGPYRNGMMPFGNNNYGYGNNFYAGSNYGNRMTAQIPMAPAMYASAEKEPEKRLETFEKKAEDGTIEKLDNDTENNFKNDNCNLEDCDTTVNTFGENGLKKLKDSIHHEKNDQKVKAH